MSNYFYLINSFIVYHIKLFDTDMSYSDFKKILNIDDDSDEYYKKIEPKWCKEMVTNQKVGVNEESFNIMKDLIKEYPTREALYFIKSRIGDIDEIIKNDINNFDLYYYGHSYINNMLSFFEVNMPRDIYNYLIKEKRKYRIVKINKEN